MKQDELKLMHREEKQKFMMEFKSKLEFLTVKLAHS